MRRIGEVIRGCILAVLLMEAALGDDGVFVTTEPSGAPIAVRDQDRLWVYWPDTVVREPVLTMHDLPDLKPVWTHRPLTRVPRGFDRSNGIPRDDLRPGIQTLQVVNGVLLYQGRRDQVTSEYVGVDGLSGAVRYRIRVERGVANIAGRSVGNRWLLAADSRVFDAETGDELAHVDGLIPDSLQAEGDTLVYLATFRGGPGRGCRLRRMRLPTGKLDADLSLDEVVEQAFRLPSSLQNLVGANYLEVQYQRFSKLIARDDVAIVRLGGSATRLMVAYDLATGRQVWSTANASMATEAFVLHFPNANVPLIIARDWRRTSQLPVRFFDVTEINVATGEATRTPQFELPDHSFFKYFEPFGAPLTVVADPPRAWALLKKHENGTTALVCLDFTSQEVVWQQEFGNATDARLIDGAASQESGHLVVTRPDLLQVFHRDTGAKLSELPPAEIGPAPPPKPEWKPPRRTRRSRNWFTRLVSNTPSERWLLGLFVVPLGWLVWRLAQRKPVA